MLRFMLSSSVTRTSSSPNFRNKNPGIYKGEYRPDFFLFSDIDIIWKTTRRVHHHFSRCPRGPVNNRFLPRLLAQGAAEGIYSFMLSSSVALASSSSKTYKTRRCRTGSKYVSGSAPSMKLPGDIFHTYADTLYTAVELTLIGTLAGQSCPHAPFHVPHRTRRRS